MENDLVKSINISSWLS